MTKDLVNNTSSVVAVSPQAVSGDGNVVGEIIDLDGYESGKFSLVTGAVTTGTIALVSIEESDDPAMSGSTAIPAERLIALDVTPLTAVNEVAEVGFISNYRYVRLTIVGAGTADLLASASCELGDPNQCPTK
jgi:hypothetical protein